MRPRIAFAVGVHWCPFVSAIQALTRSNGSERTSRNRYFRVHTAEVTGSKPVAPTTFRPDGQLVKRCVHLLVAARKQMAITVEDGDSLAASSMRRASPPS